VHIVKLTVTGHTLLSFNDRRSSQGTPANILIYLCGGSRKFWFVYFCKSDVSAVQGHPRSLILARIESAYAISY